MLIIGMHFGHDASISIIKDNATICCVEIERIRGIKHALGIKAKEVEDVIRQFGFAPQDVDACAITTSQGIEFLFDEPSRLTFHYICNSDDHLHVTKWSREKGEDFANGRVSLEKNVSELMRRANPQGHPFYKYLKNGYQEPQKYKCLGTFEDYIPVHTAKDGDLKVGIDERFEEENAMSDGFRYPVKVNLLGYDKPGYVYSHHYAHACYAHYEAEDIPKIIFSHDGSLPTHNYRSGAIYRGINETVEMIGIHNLGVGKLYEVTSGYIGFEEDSGPGKMMGLAPYGQKVKISEKYVGNCFQQLGREAVNSGNYRQWVNELCEKILECGKYPKTGSLDVNQNPMEERCLTIAATVQALTEEILAEACYKATRLVKPEDGITCLALTGGTALNCPANKVIAQRINDFDIFVPPAVHDGGLSIGAAKHLGKAMEKGNLITSSAKTSKAKGLGETAYLGRIEFKKEDLHQRLLDACCNETNLKIETERVLCKAAELLAENNVIAVFNSRSEIGPRALGSRSILAGAKDEINWRRVNKIKKREQWRPFAPIVMAGYEKEQFDIEPNVMSYSYMLVTADVKNNELKAITHKDKSARLQVLSNNDNPSVYELMDKYRKLTGIPVLMNTSFNGPGEPVIETIERAILFLKDTDDFKAILFGKEFLVTKEIVGNDQK